MRSSGGTESPPSASDPWEVLSGLALLIVEGRIPGGDKGFHAGPHCSSVLSIRSNHLCNPSGNDTCARAMSLLRQLRVMWSAGVDISIEVLVAPECEHGAAIAAAIDTSKAMTKHTLKLIELWTFAVNHKPSTEGGVTGSTLIAAVRSFLHFSQLSAWLSLSDGRNPPHLIYRLTVSSPMFCTKFDGSSEEHVFPLACFGIESAIKVTCRSVPRSTEIPFAICSEKHGEIILSSANEREKSPKSVENRNEANISSQSESHRHGSSSIVFPASLPISSYSSVVASSIPISSSSSVASSIPISSSSSSVVASSIPISSSVASSSNGSTSRVNTSVVTTESSTSSSNDSKLSSTLNSISEVSSSGTSSEDSSILSSFSQNTSLADNSKNGFSNGHSISKIILPSSSPNASSSNLPLVKEGPSSSASSTNSMPGCSKAKEFESVSQEPVTNINIVKVDNSDCSQNGRTPVVPQLVSRANGSSSTIKNELDFRNTKESNESEAVHESSNVVPSQDLKISNIISKRITDSGSSRGSSPDFQLGESLLDPPSSSSRLHRSYQSPSRSGSPSRETPDHFIGRPRHYSVSDIRISSRRTSSEAEKDFTGTVVGHNAEGAGQASCAVRPVAEHLQWTQTRYPSNSLHCRAMHNNYHHRFNHPCHSQSGLSMNSSGNNEFGESSMSSDKEDNNLTDAERNDLKLDLSGLDESMTGFFDDSVLPPDEWSPRSRDLLLQHIGSGGTKRKVDSWDIQSNSKERKKERSATERHNAKFISDCSKSKFELSSEETVQILRTLHQRPSTGPLVSTPRQVNKFKFSAPINIEVGNDSRDFTKEGIDFTKEGIEGEGLNISAIRSYRNSNSGVETDSEDEFEAKDRFEEEHQTEKPNGRSSPTSVNAVKVVTCTKMYKAQSESLQSVNESRSRRSGDVNINHQLASIGERVRRSLSFDSEDERKSNNIAVNILRTKGEPLLLKSLMKRSYQDSNSISYKHAKNNESSSDVNSVRNDSAMDISHCDKASRPGSPGTLLGDAEVAQINLNGKIESFRDRSASRTSSPAINIPSSDSSRVIPILNNSTKLFNFNTGLPLTSSPAPLRKGGRSFDFDSSLNSIAAIKRSTSFHSSALSPESSYCECMESMDSLCIKCCRQALYSASAPATITSSNLLGTFEECVLHGRIEPSSTVQGFKAQIAASGSFCSDHITKPVTVLFFNLTDNDQVSSPYMGFIKLEKKGYKVPPKGTVQVTLLNPLGTVVKMFVVMYDLSDMPPNAQTFLRQRTLNMPVGASEHDPDAHSWLRYLVHLKFASSKSGKVYLHTDVRLLIFRRSDADAAVVHKTGVQYEYRSFTHGPTEPKYSPRK